MLRATTDTLLGDDGVRLSLLLTVRGMEWRGRGLACTSRCWPCVTRCRCCNDRDRGAWRSVRRTAGSGCGLSRVWPACRTALVIVRPETVVGWLCSANPLASAFQSGHAARHARRYSWCSPLWVRSTATMPVLQLLHAGWFHATSADRRPGQSESAESRVRSYWLSTSRSSVVEHERHQASAGSRDDVLKAIELVRDGAVRDGADA
jgi:hypothetical protein